MVVMLLFLGCKPDNDVDTAVIAETGLCLETWFVDSDGDGFGSDLETIESCSAQEGWADNDQDCDDTNPAVFPGSDEICNGIDDDCDGLVDDEDDPVIGAETWYEDADGDGYGRDNQDCDDEDELVNPEGVEYWYDGVDSDCDGFEDPEACEDEPTEGVVVIDATCTYTPTGSLSPTTEWHMTSFSDSSSYDDPIMTPVVGHLTDDNGDGFIPDGDIPDIVAVFRNAGSSTKKGALRSISGDGSAVHWTLEEFTLGASTYNIYRYAGVALGDIDGDGEPEIVTTAVTGSTCYPVAFSADGTPEWIQETSVGCRSHAPALHDLEGDGDPEVIFGHLRLSGDDGSVEATGSGGRGYYSSYSNSGYHAFAVDLDGDGISEWLAGSSVYDPSGNEICNTGTSDGYPSAADLDGDGVGEFVVSGNGMVRIFEADCTLIAQWNVVGGGFGGPSTIADFDGDGDPEIGVAGSYNYTVHEVDGTTLWSNGVQDHSSNSTGSSVFDFDGDGAAEVVYADEVKVRIYDGATGVVILEHPHDSGTINEYPVIADADGDGKAEIVVGHDGSPNGIEVIGDENDEWVSARQVWNQHAYYITNIDDDLGIPAPSSNWPSYNNFRQGAPGAHLPQAAANLYVLAYGACQEDCGEDVELLVQAVNDGQIPVSGDVEIAVWGDTGTEWEELARESLGANLDAGAIGPAKVFVFSPSELLAYQDIQVTIDDPDASNECDETDNEGWFDLSTLCE